MKLAALKVLEARVVEMPTRNQVVVETALGQLSLRTPQALPVVPGSQITLQLANTLNEQVQVRLTAIDGKPTGPAHTPPPQVQPQAAPPLAAGISAGVQGFGAQRPAGIPAVVVQVPPAGTVPAAGAPSWPLGTELTVRLATVTPAANPAVMTLPSGMGSAPAMATGGNTLPTGQTALAGSPGATAAAAGQAATVTAGSTAPAPAPGTAPVGGQPTAPLNAASPLTATTAPSPAAAGAPVLTSTATAPAPTVGVNAAASAPTVLTGTVQAHPAGGLALVSTSAGTLALQAPAALAPGATVVLEVTAAQTPQPPQITPLPLPLPGGPAGAAFAQAMTTLSTLDPEAARRMATMLPAPDGRMLTNTVAFAQAAASGDIRAWIGNDALRALDKAGPRGARALRGLGDGLRDAASTVRDGSGAEWRTLSMPFAVGGTIERIQIITRRHGDAEDGENERNGKGGGSQRFLIQLDLSRLGALQLDGLYKKHDRRLDLIVRTHAALPTAMRHEIAGIFANSALALALKGGVTFHVSDRFAGPPVGAEPTLNGMMV